MSNTSEQYNFNIEMDGTTFNFVLNLAGPDMHSYALNCDVNGKNAKERGKALYVLLEEFCKQKGYGYRSSNYQELTPRVSITPYYKTSDDRHYSQRTIIPASDYMQPLLELMGEIKEKLQEADRSTSGLSNSDIVVEQFGKSASSLKKMTPETLCIPASVEFNGIRLNTYSPDVITAVLRDALYTANCDTIEKEPLLDEVKKSILAMQNEVDEGNRTTILVQDIANTVRERLTDTIAQEDITNNVMEAFYKKMNDLKKDKIERT